MKKIILMMALLGTVGAYAQVGINKEKPQATLDINVQEDNKSNDHLEGLLIPRVSKEKAFQMAGNDQLQESTLIYVNETSNHTGTEAEVADITGNGYYFWNGTKWVKQTGQDGEEWVYDPATKQISLKRSGQDTGFTNKVFYDEYGGYKDIDFAMRLEGPALSADETGVQRWSRLKYTKDNLDFNYFTPYNAIIKNASSIPTSTNIAQGGEGRKYIKFLNYNILNVDKTVGTEDATYQALSGGVVVRKSATIGTPINGITGVSSYLDYLNSAKVGTMNSFTGGAYLREGATADYVRGGYFSVENEGDIKYLEGVHSSVESKENSHTDSFVALFTRLRHRGSAGSIVSANSILDVKENSNAKYAIGLNNQFVISPNTTITTLYGNRLVTGDIDASADITDFYGIYLEDVNKASGKNFAIYTKAGDIRFGDLADNTVTEDRLVVANTDGVLGTSATTLSDLESLWANDDSNTRVYLKNTSAGAPRTDSGDDRNSVAFDNEGFLIAKGLKGYNGSTIFPDYVFEKYYNGYSDIKTDYNFHNLASIESFVKKNGHLPGYKSAKEIAKEGLIDFGATQLTNIEKIEELYLHLIEKEKEVQELKAELQSQKEEFEARLERLENLMNK